MEPMDIVGKSKEDASLPKGEFNYGFYGFFFFFRYLDYEGFCFPASVRCFNLRILASSFTFSFSWCLFIIYCLGKFAVFVVLRYNVVEENSNIFLGDDPT